MLLLPFTALSQLSYLSVHLLSVGRLHADRDPAHRVASLPAWLATALMVSYELSLGSALLSVALFTDDGTGMKCLNFQSMVQTHRA